jgi:ferrous iron transport protein B
MTPSLPFGTRKPKILSLSNQSEKCYKVALLGNPNSGKSSLFNALTGLNQKISNYPGVTVDKKTGLIPLSDGGSIELIDFPGIYSLYPNSTDEKLVVEVLTNPDDPHYPDAIIYVASCLELEKHFLLATQLKELEIPMIVCLTMADLFGVEEVNYDRKRLADYLDTEVLNISSLKNINLDVLGAKLEKLIVSGTPEKWSGRYRPGKDENRVISRVGEIARVTNDYQNLLIGHHHAWLHHLSPESKLGIRKELDDIPFNSMHFQISETMKRYDSFIPVVKRSTIREKETRISLTERIDRIVTNRYLGPVLFFAIMFLVFQAIYSWAEWPMTWIESFFASGGIWIKGLLPEGWFSDLITDGIWAGLGGIMVFIPQIAILFLLISILEEVGYMSRAVFMFDGLMKRFGLNGRSIVALISGGACAIPAIMSTRTIANWKERLITIMVTPLISCSARIPVYTVLIAFVVPQVMIGGIFNAQGLAFMGLYVLGILAALISALVFKIFIKSEEPSFLMIELPIYRKPLVRNVFLTVKEKVLTFVVEAGKIIIIISILLWFLASYGPGNSLNNAEIDARSEALSSELSESQTEDLVASRRLEASYAGILGRSIEPMIEPLGFDWKIGIALITSFAAREVFVGTMATIYSVGSSEDELTLRQRMSKELNSKTGKKRFDLPTSLSLLLFYAFALQCMSTLAITKRETNSWKWPVVQFVFMGLLAYMSSLITYQILS